VTGNDSERAVRGLLTGPHPGARRCQHPAHSRGVLNAAWHPSSAVWAVTVCSVLNSSGVFQQDAREPGRREEQQDVRSARQRRQRCGGCRSQLPWWRSKQPAPPAGRRVTEARGFTSAHKAAGGGGCTALPDRSPIARRSGLAVAWQLQLAERLKTPVHRENCIPDHYLQRCSPAN